ncbi:MAG TPA: hypothetical protein VNZ86_16425, partial [Bacteroidia bacterium]|nr:hypothetical protein [Bacteroidia bacterium]
TWLWNLNGAPVLRKYASHLQAYDASRGVLVLLSNVNNELVCTSVLASSGKIVTRLKLSALTKRINAMADSLLFPGGPNPTKQKHPPLIFRISSARLSNNGGFASVQCYLKGTETGMTLVMNNLSKECTLWQSDKGTSPDLRWVGDSTFVLYKNEKLAYLMNARSEGTAMPLSGTFEFGRSRNERFIPVAKQLTQIRWSDNYRYVALPEKFKGVDRIYLHPTLIKQDKSIADSASFLCFGPESRMLYFQNPEQKLGFINTGDIEADMGGDRISKHFFSDTLVIPIQGEIVHDPNPPPGYFFPRITSFKHIREANASTPLHVYLKTMGINGTDNSLQVHLIDTNGVYYYGAADSAWRKIWCNLLLLNQDKATQITDFGITEYREDNNFYNGMCVAMDFSGSMGQGRGTLLQNGVLKFIASKLEH